ncbi:MAG: FAD binding domain-containing protein [Planctomycetota bacterium]|jgi:carbon-monoxide dehydrogenase medium subunit
MITKTYHRPRTLAEALALVAADRGARLIAGGTDLLVGSTPPPEALVSLRGIPELAGIDGSRIGALTTVGEVIRDPRLARDYPVLVQAASRLGSAQIRNQATIGGNLCRAAPCADFAPPLLVLEARLDVAGPTGTREVPVDQFFRGPGVTCLEDGEVVTAVRLPPPRPGAVGLFLKKGRVHMDLSIASVALLLEADGRLCRRIRLAAGSVAPTPVRLHGVEDLLGGRELDDALLAEARALASREVMPITDVRSTEAYRRHIIGVYVERGLRRAMEAM